ncbi:LytTR family transcriptional regulator DNA-binding domain-containing protein [Lactobacillus equicursoris]|uniref:LytTR family transcriptional regulator DNA-binding domain-containing protein n=1 Tax=Lactobacillus equicursoris TaxID=420645 RepID=UPI0039925FE7
MLLEYYWQFYYIATAQFPHKLELVTRGTRVEFVGNLTQVLEKTDFLVQVSQSLLVNPKNITSSCFS